MASIIKLSIWIFEIYSLFAFGISDSSVNNDRNCTVEDRMRLLDGLGLRRLGINESGYDKGLNPTSVKLELGLSLVRCIVIFNNGINCAAYLNMMWNDERLKWNESSYGGCEVIQLDSMEVWKPDLTLYNTIEPDSQEGMNCRPSNIIIHSGGFVSYTPRCRFRSRCESLQSMFSSEANKTATCSLNFGSWTFDKTSLDLQLFKGMEQIDLSEYVEYARAFDGKVLNKLVSTNVQRNEKFFHFSKEPFSFITFNLTFKGNN